MLELRLVQVNQFTGPSASSVRPVGGSSHHNNDDGGEDNDGDDTVNDAGRDITPKDEGKLEYGVSQ